jgi:mRNA interferase RelE/StbE
VKQLVYTVPALKTLKSHGNMQARIMKVIAEYAADQAAHRNQVTALVGVAGKRLRVGAFRVIFEETAAQIIVTKIGPRGDVYEDGD